MIYLKKGNSDNDAARLVTALKVKLDWNRVLIFGKKNIELLTEKLIYLMQMLLVD